MDKNQKNWETPQLIILARGTPEENVLTHCKQIDTTPVQTSGPGETAQSLCMSQTKTNTCANCQSRGGKAS